VRLWDLAAGVPVSVSRPHGGTVRAVALDDGALASGGSDHAVRLWDASASSAAAAAAGEEGAFDPADRGGGGGGPLFDLSAPGRPLAGHIGPVTSLSLTRAALYSGSWDTTVRVWSRSDE
jgi:WD40 repeat protein